MAQYLAFNEHNLSILHLACSSATPPVGIYADTLMPGLLVFIGMGGQMIYEFKYKRFGIIFVEQLGFFREMSLARAKEYIHERFLSGEIMGIEI